MGVGGDKREEALQVRRRAVDTRGVASGDVSATEVAGGQPVKGRCNSRCKSQKVDAVNQYITLGRSLRPACSVVLALD